MKTKQQLLAEIEKMLVGIDTTEISSAYGWWETSTGAEFGAKKLNEIRALLKDAYGDRDWISVSERMPDMNGGVESERVLVVAKIDDENPTVTRVEFGRFTTRDRWVIFDDSIFWGKDCVTHWMPIPAAPE